MASSTEEVLKVVSHKEKTTADRLVFCLDILSIALEGLKTAAAAGNVTAQETMKEITKMCVEADKNL